MLKSGGCIRISKLKFSKFSSFTPKRKIVVLLFLLLLFFAACFTVVSVSAGAGAGNIGAWFPFIYFFLLFFAAYNPKLLGKLLKRAYRPLTAVFYAGMFAVFAAFAAFAVFILGFPGDTPEKADLAIVLGCQVYGDRPGDTLKSRLDAAVGILAEYPDLICVVSGGQGPDETVPEADTMEKYLIGRNIAPGRIYKESESSSTFTNMTLSKLLMEENELKYENIIILTNEYHIPRAMMIAKRVYPDSNIYAVKADCPLSLLGSGLMREFFAFVKSYIFDKAPGQSRTPPKIDSLAYADKDDETFGDLVRKFSLNSAAMIFADGKNKNLCYSPPSLYVALALAASGAANRTQAEMFAALGLTGRSKEYIYGQIDVFLKELHFENRYGTAKIADSIWLKENAEVNQDFQTNAENNFQSQLFNVNFSDIPATPDMMRKWVEENTNNLISPAFDYGDPKLIFMYIINTLYFKDSWRDSFDERGTGFDLFHAPNKKDVECEFMYKFISAHRYFAGDGFTASSLELYNGGQMTFLLPEENTDIYDLLSSPVKMDYIFDQDNAKTGDVRFKVPKFAARASFDLIGTLQNLGVTEAFIAEKADFSGITTGEPVYISQVSQDTYIKIDERGVEAAAMTQIEMYAGGIAEPNERIDMVLDRPFMYFITDKNDTVLFSGVIFNPTEAPGKQNILTEAPQTTDLSRQPLPYKVGNVTVISKGIEYKPYEHMKWVEMIMENGQMLCADGVPLSLEKISGTLPQIPCADDFQVVVEGEYLHSCRYSLYDDTFELVYENETFIFPIETGIYLLCVDASWNNKETDPRYLEATGYRYVFKIANLR